jgi:TrkA domain protein
MTDIETAALPGIGHLHVMTTLAGRSVGVIRHRGDRRELIIYDSDPDTVGTSVCLTRDEVDGLAGMLGANFVANHIARLEHGARDVVTLQVLIGPDPPPRTVAAARRRSGRDATIAAVIRDGVVHADPPPHLQLRTDDVVVVVGTRAGALDLLDVITKG